MNIRKRRVLFIVVAAVVLLGGAYFYLSRSGILADMARRSPIVAKGASFMPGADLAGTNILTEIKKNRITVYSYNEKSNPGEKWTVLKANCNAAKADRSSDIKCVTSMDFDPRLAYLVQNTGSSVKLSRSYNSKSGQNAAVQSPLGKGKHLTFWGSGDIQSRYIKEALVFTFPNNSSYTFQEAWQAGLLSSKITFLNPTENSNNPVKTLKDVTLAGDADTMIKNESYFFLEVTNENLGILKINVDNKVLAAAKTKEKDYPLSLSFTLAPKIIDLAKAGGLNPIKDIEGFGVNAVRFIGFDYNGTVDTALASDLHKVVGNMNGGFYLGTGKIIEERQFPTSELVSSKGTQYKNYAEVIDDICLYSGYQPSSTAPVFYTKVDPDWEKLKKLLEYHFFKGTVLPRLAAYKDSIKYWQDWNEPDANLNSFFGIPAEALSLITTGKVVVDGKTIQFGDKKVEYDGKKYSLKNGIGGNQGIVKQMCSDCSVLAAGFYRVDNSAFFQILKDNHYNDYVDAYDMHLGLDPRSEMAYTLYYDEFKYEVSILDTLCGGVENCNKPIWSTEMGSPSDVVFQNNYNPPTFTMTFSRDFQSDDMVKRFVTMANMGLSNLSWERYVPDSTEECKTTADSSGVFHINKDTIPCAHQLKSLYYPEGDTYSKKPAYATYKLVISKMLNTTNVELLNQIDTTHKTANQLFLYAITKADGKQAIAAWCDPFWDKADVTTGDWSYENGSCSTNISLKEYNMQGKVKITDKNGSESNGQADKITVTKSPIFIEQP